MAMERPNTNDKKGTNKTKQKKIYEEEKKNKNKELQMGVFSTMADGEAHTPNRTEQDRLQTTK